MIDDELLPPMGEPVKMRLRKGVFHGDLPKIGEIICVAIEGVFQGICPTTFKGYPYYALQIEDATNMYQVMFVPQASNLKDLVLAMSGERFSNIYIEGYIDHDGRSRMGVYLDGKSSQPHCIELPTIKRVRDGKGKPYYCLYDDRIKKIAELIDKINKSNHIQPMRVR